MTDQYGIHTRCGSKWKHAINNRELKNQNESIIVYGFTLDNLNGTLESYNFRI